MTALVQVYNNSGGGLLGRRGEQLVTAMGGQTPVRLDPAMFRYGSGIGLIVNIQTGSAADYDVEMSGSDPSEPDTDKFWNKHDVLINKTKSAQSNLAYPVTLMRIFFRSITGIVNFSIIVPGT